MLSFQFLQPHAFIHSYNTQYENDQKKGALQLTVRFVGGTFDDVVVDGVFARSTFKELRDKVYAQLQVSIINALLSMASYRLVHELALYPA